jgi:MFS family permease
MNNLEQSGRKIVATLFISQSLSSAALILMFTIGSIVAVELANGNNQWTGIPSTISLVGAALIANPIGRLMDRAGRRVGLSVGYILGIVGALTAGWAIIQQSLPIFLVGILFTGFAWGTGELGRYAAAEASPLDQRGRAISLIVWSSTVGSIAGPSLLAGSNSLGSRVGLPDLTGPWFAAGIILTLGLVTMHFFLRPDPKEIARQYETNGPGQSEHGGEGRTFLDILQDSRTKLAIGAMTCGQLAMTVVMTVTAVYMRGLQHELGAISLVIMAHTMGMFGLSFVTGWLVDKFGRTRNILVGGLILVVSCIIAPLSTEVIWLAVALFLLGLGWNFCFVAGSALLDDVLRSSEKGRVQGSVDALVKTASGVGSLSSGLVFAAAGFALTSWITVLFAAIPIALVLLLNVADRSVSLSEAAPG